jgi:hypothetical protein
MNTYIASEVEPKRQAAPVKATPEPTRQVKVGKDIVKCRTQINVPLMREFPFTIDYSKRNVFIWWTSTEVQKNSFVVSRFLDNLVRWRLCFVYEIRIEDVELYRYHEVSSELRN